MQAYAAAASAGPRGNIGKPSRKEGIIRSKSLRRKLYSQVSDLISSRWPISSGSGPQNRGGWCDSSTGFHLGLCRGADLLETQDEMNLIILFRAALATGTVHLTCGWITCALLLVLAVGSAGCVSSGARINRAAGHYVLNYTSPTDPALQAKLEAIDTTLRAKYGMAREQTSVGVLDLQDLRLAMVHPDHMEYAASIPKVGILLAYFQLHPEAATKLDPQTRHELGLMAKASNNEMAAKFSKEMGLKEIQKVLNSYHFYDTNHGGGIWVGKHYGKGGERIGDPLSDISHAATVRQLLRFYLMLEQDKLVSPAASKTMREIFASPDIPHDDIKFVKGLADRDVQILRKWGSWENWLHDSADVTGPGRHYVMVALINHPKGDEYLVEFAKAVDDLISSNNPQK
jgi:beta-lactamase class A